MEIDYRYQFHPVGQGLFCSGLLWKHQIGRDFAWVYDCGSDSGKNLVDREIDRLKKHIDGAGQRPRLDLVVISHFDHDHISGLVRLLKNFSVGRLVLPYMPLWHRLLIACDESATPADEAGLTVLRFAANPTRFISQQIDGASIEEIVYVLPGDEPPPPGELAPREPNNNDPWRITFDPPEINPERQPEDIGAAGNNTPPKLRFIESGSRILADNFWEFVPYNDQMVAVVAGGQSLKDFQAEINNLANALLDNPEDQALKKIKASYDARFGKTSKPRNIVSLFLYSGPLSHYEDHSPQLRYRSPYYIDMPCRCFPHSMRRHPGVLYTGDGYLETPAQLASLITHLTQERINDMGYLQVMHHGSSTNWHDGVASALNPQISVFSSDPLHKSLKHPHAEVLRDFWLHGPIQVDKIRGAYLSGKVTFL